MKAAFTSRARAQDNLGLRLQGQLGLFVLTSSLGKVFFSFPCKYLWPDMQQGEGPRQDQDPGPVGATGSPGRGGSHCWAPTVCPHAPSGIGAHDPHCTARSAGEDPEAQQHGPFPRPQVRSGV